jgi:two-component system, chemotaxis family, sensor kinase CheA
LVKGLRTYLVLPVEISQFERQYLARMNRIALIFFFCHLPVFMGVAVLAGTGVSQAAILTALALIGPAVASQTLRNPRHVSVVFGFTAMCMGGILVHVGRGAMQIEMHFYFFVLIALLAVFANPMVIFTAALTVALHHLTLYLLLPRSVFNYDASIWAVAVHFAFVVLESIAACFVARSFFDNVIGLEKIVQSRTDALSDRNRDMRLVLDNVGQGFLTVDPDGLVSAERSAIAARWVGGYVPGKKIWEHLGELDPSGRDWFRVAWEAIGEDVLPLELSIDQLPKRWGSGPTTFALEYRPLVVEGKLTRVLVVMSDVTAQVEREQLEIEQRDFVRVFQCLRKDKKGLLEFFSEADDLVSKLVGEELPVAEVRRLLHTLKGNSALFGLSALAAFCHDLESNLLETDGALTGGEREQLGRVWGALAVSLRGLLGGDRTDRVEIDQAEYEAVLDALDGNGAREEIALRIKGWQFEPSQTRLTRLAEQARAIASRLGKGNLNVVIEPNDVQLFPGAWSAFWSAFTHAIRNAVDHGIEFSDERLAAGKPAQGQLRLTTQLLGDELVVEIADDGRGIAWSLVRERAAAAGLPFQTREDLVEALFWDGLTTKGEVSELSGRGIGMGALRAICRKMGGSLQVSSTPGQGTCLSFHWTKVHDRVDSLAMSPVPPAPTDNQPQPAGGHIQ